MDIDPPAGEEIPPKKKIPNLKSGAIARRLQARNTPPTAHQQHLTHEQHMKNVNNNPRKYK